MRKWPFQDSIAQFSERLNACLTKGPQMVARRDADAAETVAAKCAGPQQTARPPLKRLLLDDGNRWELVVRQRANAKRRARTKATPRPMRMP